MGEIQRLLHDPAFYRLGLTLAHFLWQGTVLALLALLLRAALRRLRPAVRYLILLGLFAAMAATPVLTFTLWTKSPPPAVMTMTEMQRLLAAAARQRPAHATLPAAGDAAAPAGWARLRSSLGSIERRLRAVWWRVRGRLPVAGLLWMLGVLVLSLRLLVQWGLFVRVVRRATLLDEERWRRPLASLSERLGVRRAVRLLRSVEVGVPTVAGWLRPVILLPPAALLGLTPEQLEAVIAHELAHIRRHDFLVNVLQRAVEVLLFYHPAVWWLSGLIRVERELCCDDLAVRATGNAVSYARALEQLEELRWRAPEPALAAARGPVLVRVRRLVLPVEANRRPLSWSTLAFPGLALAAILLTSGLLPVGAQPYVAGTLMYAEVERQSTSSHGETGGDTARVLSGRSEWIVRDASPFHLIEYSPRGDEVLFAQPSDACPPGCGLDDPSTRPPSIWKARLDLLGRPDFSRAVNLTHLAGLGWGDSERARWSPDGSRVLLEFIPCGCGLPQEEADRWCEREQLWVMNGDGSDAHQIHLPPRRVYAGHMPTQWTSDGSLILLGAAMLRPASNALASGCFVADADGGALWELPVWRGAISPNGRWVIGARDAPPLGAIRMDPPEKGLCPVRSDTYRWELLLLSSDGASESTLLGQSYPRDDMAGDPCGIADSLMPHDFAWSPDSRQVAFLSAMDWDRSGPPLDSQTELYIYDLPSRRLTQVTHDDIEQCTPVWME